MRLRIPKRTRETARRAWSCSNGKETKTVILLKARSLVLGKDPAIRKGDRLEETTERRRVGLGEVNSRA